ncbi:hypothetical protein N0V82_005575 [Gnomoniopsis sp. IMI 355080]|nr:hypothetical protein N0V82_005575 [Gnomoniopsis sp. IMI 355080]
MPGVTGHGILSRVRSHRKMRTEIAAEEMETPRLITHRRQHSDGATVSRSSSTRVDYRGHYPPIEFDPLKLNPPVPQAPHAPPRLHERQTLGSLHSKRSFASAGNRRPARLHRSESGFSLEGYQQFDFSLERDNAMRMIERNRQREHDVDMRGWPSPASSVDSVDSGKSWFDDDDSQDEVDTVAPNPQRRPPVGSPDDPTNYIKRGEWKRRGIFFGVQTEEVHTKDDEAFEV